VPQAKQIKKVAQKFKLWAHSSVS